MGLGDTRVRADGPATLWAGQYDRRILAGERVWSKPFKFARSLAIHFATFSVIAACLPEDERRRTFNTSTPVEAVAAALMGVGALIVVSPAVVVGLAIMLSPPPAWSAAEIVGTVAGLVGGAVLTVLTASQTGAARSHFANGKPDFGRTMPITGWSMNGTDLRPSHFLAPHMMQAVPIISVISAVFLPASAALVVSTLAAIAWAAMTLAVFRWTMKGLPPTVRLRVSRDKCFPSERVDHVAKTNVY